MKLFFIILLHCFMSSALESQGRFLYLKGDVKVVRGSEEIEITKENNKLLNQDVIETGKGSLAIVRIGTKSTFKINENSSFKIIPTVKKNEDSNILLKSGSVFVNFLNEDKSGTMRIKTRSAVMGVRGTQFFVSYGTDPNETWMCVKEGGVEVDSSKRGGVLVEKGEGVKIDDDVTDPKFLPWTSKLNWNFNHKKELVNNLSIEEAYQDPLNFDYD